MVPTGIIILLMAGLAFLGLGLWLYISESNNHKWRESEFPSMHYGAIITGILSIIIASATIVFVGFYLINNWYKNKYKK